MDFTPEGDIITTKGWIIDRAYGHLDFGYARTAYSSQGSSVQRVIIAQSSESFPASNREGFYVAVSRGKESVTLYTDDREGLLQGRRTIWRAAGRHRTHEAG